MENILSADFILSDKEIDNMNLFEDDSEETIKNNPEEKKEEKENKTTENDIDPEGLFSSESVGSGKEVNSGETSEPAKEGSSPNNLYYSIANALVGDGVLPDLDEDMVKNIKSAEDLADAIDKQVEARLDEVQKRVNSALNADVDVDVIRQYETLLRNLNQITEDRIKDESEKGENLRKQLIFQDLVNRGFSKERAAREVKKSFDSGMDIDDAKDALESNKSYFRKQYDALIDENKKEVDEERERLKEEALQLKKQMLEDKEIFEGVSMDKKTRQKAYDNIAKPVYKTDNGEYLTAVQKYENDNPVEFRKKLGVIFTLTNGFKNLEPLIKSRVRKEVKNNLRELEHTLKNTNRTNGELRYADYSEDPDSYSSKGWDIDI